MRQKGEEHHNAKLNMWDVIAIRALLDEKPKLYTEPTNLTRISKAFKVGRSTVRDIRDRKQWSWLP